MPFQKRRFQSSKVSWQPSFLVPIKLSLRKLEQTIWKRRLTLAIAVAIPTVTWVTFRLVEGYISPTNQTERKDVVQTVVQVLGGISILTGAYFAYQQLEVSREGQVTDRFTNAINQIGSREKPEICLGGIYALERIAKDSIKDHRAVMEVLTVYIREHRTSKAMSEKLCSVSHEQALDSSLLEIESPSISTDIQTILTVIGRRKHTYNQGEEARLNLSFVDIRGSILCDAHLEGVNFRNAHLEGVDFRNAYLEEADLRGACLDKADFRGAHLNKADLRGACLNGANLTEAFLDEADLRYAFLEETVAREAKMRKTLLQNAYIDKADFCGACMQQADLRSTHAVKAIFRTAHLEKSALSGAYMEKAIFGGTHLEKAVLKGTNLSDAILGGAHMEKAIFKGAYLMRTFLKDVHVFKTDFSSANLKDARGISNQELQQAILHNTVMPNGDVENPNSLAQNQRS